MFIRHSILVLLASLITVSPVSAWGPTGHQTIGAIADEMITGTHAETEVKALLGNITLQEASVWADCAKGVDPGKNYKYITEGKYPECKIFETPEMEAEMSDFVRRNDTNCSRKPGTESCHKEYHYTDVAIQRDHYSRSFVGTRDDDIVGAALAAIRVLKGESAPAPFSFKNKREALLLLTHYVGDIHQPLHVGAIYLDNKGRRVDPDKGTFDPDTDTQGGNKLMVKSRNLHSIWDTVPASLNTSHINNLIEDARALPVTKGPIYDWPSSWASDTLKNAWSAFSGIKFSSYTHGHWAVILPPKYSSKMKEIKQDEIIQAGAHLAQLLEAIWR